LEGLFYGCSSLKELPDISKWDIRNNSRFNSFIFKYSKENSDKTDFKENVTKWINLNMITNLSYLFYGCSSLKELPDISKWDLSFVINIRYLFYGCSSLKELPDISRWNLALTKDISYLFYGCTSLKKLPDISKWNTKNVQNLNSIFENCSSLTFIPNIAKWKFNHKININNIFKGCSSLKSIPNISKWNININIREFLKIVSNERKISRTSEDRIKYNNAPSSLKGNNNELND